MCRVLGVSPSGFYGWRSRPESARSASSRQLLDDVRRIHAAHHRRYGAPRVHAALRADGRSVSRGRVERLMRRHGIRALAGRRFRPCTTDSRHDLPIAPNLLKQDFSATRPDTVWLADITYLATGEGWLYLAAVLDLATRKIVGWSMRDHMRTELSVAALMMAAQRQRPAAGLICHSDRGSQYAAEAYRKQLAALGARPSMSRTACCYDNAAMESFFHTLKVELGHQRRWATRDEARRDLFAYIEGYYNRQRIHSALGYLTPSRPSRPRAKLPVSAQSGEDQGRAIAFRLAPRQGHELPHAVPLLDQLPGMPKWVVGDRGFTSHTFREHIWNMGARPAIPPQRHEAPVACPDWIYNNRNQVERLWARLKEGRAIATRYEKTAASFIGILSLAAALDWLKR